MIFAGFTPSPELPARLVEQAFSHTSHAVYLDSLAAILVHASSRPRFYQDFRDVARTGTAPVMRSSPCYCRLRVDCLVYRAALPTSGVAPGTPALPV